MNENRKLALKEYFKDKFLNVDFAKAFEAGWDAAMKHYFQCGKEELQSIQSGNWLDPDVWRTTNRNVCEPEPDGWLIWDEHNGRVFVEHPKGQAPSEVRLKLEQLGKPVLGPVVFKDWPHETTPKT